jgi:hypothetical protein
MAAEFANDEGLKGVPDGRRLEAVEYAVELVEKGESPKTAMAAALNAIDR